MTTSLAYGNKRVKYKEKNIYVEPVDNLHDLDDYEKFLTDRGVRWATYLRIEAVGRNKYSTKFVLVAKDWQ